MMLTYDMPSPFNAMGRRSISNVPSQALVLMNDPTFVEAARKLAERVLHASAKGESGPGPIGDAMRRVLVRRPTYAVPRPVST